VKSATAVPVTARGSRVKSSVLRQIVAVEVSILLDNGRGGEIREVIVQVFNLPSSRQSEERIALREVVYEKGHWTSVYDLAKAFIVPSRRKSSKLLL